MPETPKPSPPFEHAVHNWEVCKELHKLTKYGDWVVTTAFYSGMKFMEDTLFPNTYDHPVKPGEQNEYKTFNAYVRDFGKTLGANKHKIMSDMVNAHIDDEEVVNSYEDLKQSCHTARYINYKVGEDRVKMALEAIETIRVFCVQ
ncbi:hypothetical protein [Flagellimonas aequoris]|uniref:Uncharacterized protein n=1 Tax=Flagellimonas aequoris TaxID=2306997 RepID=A0A418NB86_9FLAO|nr:hypothetical protein [Allomuricauda aequoris]RIV73184.1 hypothetical protein D2U88_03320 [Allomuricauda aequoris]TXK06995.1 hypothetical protein FQ019_03295 [Allomuricauda aequoris]